MRIDGPYFDDFRVGETLPPAPPITIGVGETALYQAIAGDPYALALSRPLVHVVTGDPRPVVNPALALHFSIGQSTVATRRVVANLFYRGVILRRPVRVGETLSTTVEIRGLRETTRKADRPPRGMALLGIHTISDTGDVIADYERCALVPLRDPAPTGHADDLGAASQPLELAHYAAYAPIEWHLPPLGTPTDWQLGEVRRDPMRDSVTDAPALVRLTQNQAAVHRDPRLGQQGRRLVYGGHTIGLAQASLARLLPSLAHVIGWHSCDHVGPVFENDVLSFSSELTATQPVGGGRLLAFRVLVDAERDGLDEPAQVLDWQPVVFAG
jgi:2-methylfumaryl-CoA hydratase